MDDVSESHLASVHPELARRVREMAEKVRLNGPVIRVTCGLRTWAQQDVLFDQGRTLPGKVVTNAAGGRSAHNFGYAVDIAVEDEAFPMFKPDWNSMDIQWKQVLGMALGCGLAEGAQWRSFPDMPHLYLNELPADPTEEMRSVLQRGGMDALWAYFSETYKVPLTEAV
jgi:peptidoglycan L-alanyl-D-glutamate endopeptidase CwlK